MNKFLFTIAFLLSLVFVSCESDDDTAQVSANVSVNLPNGIENATLNNATLNIRNINTGITSAVEIMLNADNSITFTCAEGMYDLSFEASISYSIDGNTVSSSVKAYSEAVQLTNAQPSTQLNLFLYNENANFVIAEIFFTGTLTPEGKQYTGDKYFRIFNNSDSTLYADGLVIMESCFNTTSKRDYTPDIMSEAFAAQALYMIPGNGKDVPVEAGKSILICDNAIDHRNANSNSFDLSNADFEWYDESSNANFTDIDNPAITNMDKMYCYTASIWGPHNRGFCAYALGKMQTDKEDYLNNYVYDYSYDLVTTAGTFTMDGNCYKFPNSWILDAVNLSIESKFQWTVTAPSLDQGWSYCGTIDKDATRYGKSVRRKQLSTHPNGLPILKDTGNSTLDFDAEQTANPYYFE